MTPFPASNRLHVWWARRPLVAMCAFLRPVRSRCRPLALSAEIASDSVLKRLIRLVRWRGKWLYQRLVKPGHQARRAEENVLAYTSVPEIPGFYNFVGWADDNQLKQPTLRGLTT